MSGGNGRRERATRRTAENKETIYEQENESIRKSGKECGRETKRFDEKMMDIENE